MNRSSDSADWPTGNGAPNGHAPDPDPTANGEGLAAARQPPVWFWIAVVFALLFELGGFYSFVHLLRTSRAAMPADQQALDAALPRWVLAAYGVATGVGVVAAIMLAARRKESIYAFFLSLVAVAVQFGGGMLLPTVRAATPPIQLVWPALIFAISYGCWQISLTARNRDWLQ